MPDREGHRRTYSVDFHMDPEEAAEQVEAGAIIVVPATALPDILYYLDERTCDWLGVDMVRGPSGVRSKLVEVKRR